MDSSPFTSLFLRDPTSDMYRSLRVASGMVPLVVAVLVATLFAACGVRAGASPRGSISGRVVDARGDGVAGVDVDADPGSPEAVGILTGDDGAYTMPPVIPGRHSVVPMRDGLPLADPKFINVAAGQHVTVDFQLEE